MSGYIKIPVVSGGGSGSVDSVFGRSGDVLPQPGDYSASQVDVTPAGNITSEDVQSALEELDEYIDGNDQLIQDHISDTTDAHDASAISYDNTSSQLTANNVQTAIDEVINKVKSSNVIYVTKLGNDTTGNGSYIKPYLTVAKAVSTIISPTSANRFLINIGVGTFIESTLTLKPWTWFCGQPSILMGGPSRISVSSGAVTLDPLWVAGSQRGGFINLYMTGSTGINFDRQAISGSSSVVYEFFNVGMNGGLNIKASQSTLDFVDAFGIRVFGASTVSGGSVQIYNSQLLNDLTINTSGSQDFEGEIFYSNIAGNLSVTSTLSNTAALQINSSKIDGTKTYIGSGTTVTTPLGYYKPSNDSDWSSIPSTVNEALDILAVTSSSSKYTSSFNNTTDWELDSDYYKITISVGVHDKGASPNCKVYENISSIFYDVYPSISMDSSGNLSIQVTSNPDNRFAGKLIVQ